jgi:hypothetical protein
LPEQGGSSVAEALLYTFIFPKLKKKHVISRF